MTSCSYRQLHEAVSTDAALRVAQVQSGDVADATWQVAEMNAVNQTDEDTEVSSFPENGRLSGSNFPEKCQTWESLASLEFIDGPNQVELHWRHPDPKRERGAAHTCCTNLAEASLDASAAVAATSSCHTPDRTWSLPHSGRNTRDTST